jgi:membrane fusion protein (multidrug efflux system)
MREIMKKIVLMLIVVPVFFACSKQEKTKKHVEKARAIEVSVVKPVKKAFYKTYEANGYLETDLDLDIKPEISGKIIKINVEEGDFVKKGQILAQVETTQYKNLINAKKAQIESIKAQIKEKKAYFEKRKLLYEKNFISEEEYLSAKTAYETALSQLKSVEAELENLKKNLKETFIKSPFTGFVNKRYISLGDYVNQNTKTFNLVSTEEIKAVFKVPQKIFKHIKRGENIDIVVKDYGKFSSKIVYMSPKFDENSMATIKSSLKNAVNLRPNMYAVAVIKYGKKVGYELPEECIQLFKNSTFVYTVDNGKAKKIKVDVVFQEYGKVYVKGELKGKSVIVQNAFKVREGTPVKVVE